MASESTSWPEGGVADGVKNWLTTFYGAADTEGLEAAEIFANHYSEDAVLAGPNPLIGRKGVSPLPYTLIPIPTASYTYICSFRRPVHNWG